MAKIEELKGRWLIVCALLLLFFLLVIAFFVNKAIDKKCNDIGKIKK